MNPLRQPDRVIRSRRCGGFALLGLLIVLALAGIGLMAAVDLWTLERQREREAQLLFAGDQYRLAIQRYYFGAPPGTPRTLPLRLQDLLEDERHPRPVRHLRRLYPDPITGSADWGELRVAGRIAGVFSPSEAQPVKQAGFSAAYRQFGDSTQYRQWVFSFIGSGGQPGAPGVPGGADLQPPPMPKRPASGSTP